MAKGVAQKRIKKQQLVMSVKCPSVMRDTGRGQHVLEPGGKMSLGGKETGRNLAVTEKELEWSSGGGQWGTDQKSVESEGLRGKSTTGSVLVVTASTRSSTHRCSINSSEMNEFPGRGMCKEASKEWELLRSRKKI